MISRKVFPLYWPGISLSVRLWPWLHFPWYVGVHLFLLCTDADFIHSKSVTGNLDFSWVLYPAFSSLPPFTKSLNLEREALLTSHLRPCASADLNCACHSPVLSLLSLEHLPGLINSRNLRPGVIMKVTLFKSDCTELKYNFYIDQQCGLIYDTCFVLVFYPHCFHKNNRRNKDNECLFYYVSVKIIFLLYSTLQFIGRTFSEMLSYLFSFPSKLFFFFTNLGLIMN